jgi:outer membrane protein assembly factor BamB
MPRIKRSFPFVVGMGWLAAAALVAQEPPTGGDAPLRVLLQQQVFDVGSGEVVARLPGSARFAIATDGTGQRYDWGAAKVDLEAGQVLDVAADRLSLRSLDGAIVWSVARAEPGIAAGATAATVLCPDRVVLPHVDGGLLALDRATGAVRWRRAECPTRQVLRDGDLLLAAGERGGANELVVMALHNGALAFRCELSEPPQRLVGGSHGIAVLGRDGWSVHDRAGPRLFAVEGAPRQLVAAADGWYGLQAGQVRKWSRTGTPLWSQPMPRGDGDDQRLRVTSEGRLLHWCYGDISDSGFLLTCLLGDDGGQLWQHREPGLGIAHSKYWHRVQVHDVARRLVVTSQAAGGRFVVELDHELGTVRSRVVLP